MRGYLGAFGGWEGLWVGKGVRVLVMADDVDARLRASADRLEALLSRMDGGDGAARVRLQPGGATAGE